MNEQKVYDVLEELNINYSKYTHPPVATIDEIKEYMKDIEVLHCKNLFLRNSKGDKHYLVVLDGLKSANLKKLAKQINSTRLSFASKERLNKYLRLEPGSVSPFGLINDEEKQVEVLIDQDIKNMDKVTFHPNINTASVILDYSGFEKFLNQCGNKVSFIEIP